MWRTGCRAAIAASLLTVASSALGAPPRFVVWPEAQRNVPWSVRASTGALPRAAEGESWHANVTKAVCGPGSLPETGLQGEVPLADQQDGRSAQGYHCNLDLVGQYAGDGASIMMASYGTCAYMATGYQPSDPEWLQKRGTVAVDVSDPAKPKATDLLQTPAMLNPWEALKVNDRSGLLATGEGGSFPLVGPESQGPHIDVYDVKTDCRHPKLLASAEIPDSKGHEGDFNGDGTIYWQSTYAGDPSVVAIDLKDPTHPKELGAFANPEGTPIHAVQLSEDGNRGYFMAARGPNSSDGFNGLEIFDTSEVQARKKDPKIHLLSKVGWDENILSQIGRYVLIGGHPYVITTDEFGAAANPADACSAGRPPYGFVHIIDVADEQHPKLVSEIRMEVNDPDNCDKTLPEQNAALSLMYSSHYCTADDPKNTTAIACSWLSSGLRVFDVRDPLHPKEIAYYNSGGRSDTTAGSSAYYEVLIGTRTKDATSTAVRWVKGADGQWQIWTMFSLGGVEILKFANGAYPLVKPAAAAKPRPRQRVVLRWYGRRHRSEGGILLRLRVTRGRLAGVTVEIRRGGRVLARRRGLTLGTKRLRVVLKRPGDARFADGPYTLVVRRGGKVLVRRGVRAG